MSWAVTESLKTILLRPRQCFLHCQMEKYWWNWSQVLKKKKKAVLTDWRLDSIVPCQLSLPQISTKRRIKVINISWLINKFLIQLLRWPTYLITLFYDQTSQLHARQRQTRWREYTHRCSLTGVTWSTTERREIRDFPYPSVFELTGRQKLTVKRRNKECRSTSAGLLKKEKNVGQAICTP